MKGYLTELIIDEKSKLVGGTLIDAKVNERYHVTVLELVRGGEKRYVELVGQMTLAAGDHLIVQGTVDDILRLRKELGASLLPDVKLEEASLAAGGQVLAEAFVTTNSRMIDRTVKELDFHHHYGGFVLAVRRVGAMLRKKVVYVRLHLSDTLLILIPGDRLDELRRSDDLVILSEREVALRHKKL